MQAYLMKTLGLIGGLTSESTAIYYRLLNQEVRKRSEDDSTSEILLWSFDYAQALPLYLNNKPGYIEAVGEVGVRLKKAGADALMILSNSAHMGAENLVKVTDLPVIHILDALAAAMKDSGVKRPLVLGTDFVMEGNFYLPNLKKRVDIDPIIPSPIDCKIANDILFNELAFGTVREESRQIYIDIIDKAKAQGADSVILGCTEHCMLLNQSHHALPVFDSTQLHTQAAVDFQLGQGA